ncbi:MAG: hypothetical protein LBT46_05810 [Planctomycetaceae bacterium]|jgi:hypothetical protein|nr:hypothetical protein [Planctomycetaceae bacterium]
MMNRRIFLFSILTGFAALCFFGGLTARCAEKPKNRLTADVLKSTLVAKTPEEILYCESVIKKRDTGIIPEKILSSVYAKAANKDRSKRFIYFKKALEIVLSKGWEQL